MDADLPRRRLRELARLGQRRYRELEGLYLVEGVRAVESAVAAGAPVQALLATPEALAEARVAAFVDAAGVPVHAVPARELERIADARTTQGVIALVTLRRMPVRALEPPIVVLDGVQDPGNVGTVIRAAAWFGARAVLAGPGTADPFGPKVVRSAMGGTWDVSIAETTDLAGALDVLRDRGLPLYGADLDGEPARDWAPPREAVLVLGSEAHGLSAAVTERLDGRVRIGGGGRPGVESLNVGVAAGILLHRWLG